MNEFRAVTESDFSAICQLIRSEEELFLVYPNGKYPLTIEQLHMLSGVREQLTVVVDGDEVIGFANLYNHQPGEFAYIGNVIIDKAYRGRGLGRAIVEYMLALASQRLGLPEVRISVFSDNAPALLLYSRLDFLPYGIEERSNLQGERVALIHMRRTCS